MKTSSKIDPANRMFEKSLNQITGKGEERYEKHKKKIFDKVYIFSHDHHGHYVLSYKIFKDFMIFGTGVKGLDISVETKFIFWKITMVALPSSQHLCTNFV